MPSYTLKASEQFVQTVSNLEKRSSATTAGEVLDDALRVYNLLKSIVPVSDGKQQMQVRTTDGEEYTIILP